MSYGLYIGKNLTADGIAYLGGYGDEPSSHWLEIIPSKNHAKGSCITVGVTSAADLPGELSQIPQVSSTAGHIRTSYSYYKGVPAPLTNGGLNEYGVAVRDIWSTSRQALIDMTPVNQCGPNYSDLARIVMERARSAREGVEIIGELIATYGESSYGGNSHLIADASEAWVVIEAAGGAGIWAAERLGDDSIRASRPGYIENIPIETKMHPDFLYSANMVEFALQQGWYAAGEPFNFNRIFGDDKGRWKGVAWIEQQMAERARRPQKIGLEDIMWAVRTETLTGDTAGYGQVVPLQNPVYSELRHLWHTQTGALAAPFVPVFMGGHNVPEEFRQHRYLTTGESSRFMDLRKEDDRETVSNISQGVESTRSACQVFKRLMYLVLQNQAAFLPEVTELWLAVEARLIPQSKLVAETALTLFKQQQVEQARAYLDYFTNTELSRALDLADDLARGIEARTRILYGISDDPEPRSADQLW
jgi:dipeptidase